MSPPPQVAIGRGLTFLAADAVKWREERGCATCHHGIMTVWALSEAKSQGFRVDAEYLDEATRWTKERFVPRLGKPRDPRPGWSLVNVPAIYLGVMSQNLPVLSRDEINLVALHLARHQEEDGTWQVPPPANGAPPIWESPETLAMWGLLAWEPHAPIDTHESAARSGREKAVAWLAKSTATNTVQASALRLLLDVRAGKSAALSAAIEDLLKRQHADGGFSQSPELASDAFATGQTLYALSFADVPHDRPEIQRAVAFLAANQREDGSWPMVSRNHPGVVATKDPIRFPVPIHYFGAAWGVLGLVRSVPAAADSPARQQFAIDLIKGFHGKYETDEAQPGRPVVRVDLRYYDVSDEEVASIASSLKAFPNLMTLEIKSAKVTDAGLAPLAGLTNLRTLVLEGAMITDGGLDHLKTIGQLQELSLKGTQITDAGAAGLEKAIPGIKVTR